MAAGPQRPWRLLFREVCGAAQSACEGLAGSLPQLPQQGAGEGEGGAGLHTLLTGLSPPAGGALPTMRVHPAAGTLQAVSALPTHLQAKMCPRPSKRAFNNLD